MPESSAEKGESPRDHEPVPTMTPGEFARHSIWQRWIGTTLLAVLLALLFGTLVWMFSKRTYEATAWLQICNKQPTLIFEDEDSERAGQNGVTTQLQLITSPMVMFGMDGVGPEGVIDRLCQGRLDGWPNASVPDLSADKARDRWYLNSWLTRGISVKQQGGEGSELYAISFSSVNPKFAQAIVNAVAGEYVSLAKSQMANQNLDLIRLLSDVNDQQTHSLEARRQALAELAEKLPGAWSVLGISGVESPGAKVIPSLRERLTGAEADLALTKAQVEAFKTSVSEWKGPFSTAGDESATLEDKVEERIESDPMVKGLREVIRRKSLELVEAEVALPEGGDKSGIAALKERIDKAKAKLDEVSENLRGPARAEVEQAMQDRRQAELEEMAMQLRSKTLFVEELKRSCETIPDAGQTHERDNLKLESARADLRTAKEVIERIQSRIVRLTTEQNAPARARMLMMAELPSSPLTKQLHTQIAMASLVGFCLPFLFAGIAVPLKRMARPRTFEDPVFGLLRAWRPGTWLGAVSLEADCRIVALISAGKAGPSDTDRQAFMELRHRYAELKPDIAEALRDACRHLPHDVSSPQSEPAPAELPASKDIWQHAMLLSLRVESPGNSERPFFVLEYGFDDISGCTMDVFVWHEQVARAVVSCDD